MLILMFFVVEYCNIHIYNAADEYIDLHKAL